MLGKLSSLVSYWKVLEVYLCKRFPSNKLPVFGMVFTYMAFYMLATRWRILKQFYLQQEGLDYSENSWNFNIQEAKCHRVGSKH